MSTRSVIAIENATDKTVTFVSLDESLATISNEGKFIFKKAGTCTFKIVTTDGEYEGSFNVTYTGGYILSAQIQEKSLNIVKNYGENLYIYIAIVLNERLFCFPIRNIYELFYAFSILNIF